MSNLASFKPAYPATLESLSNDLSNLYQLLKNAVRFVAFHENFKAKEVTVIFPGVTEVTIVNPFPDGTIPSRWVVVDVQNGGTFTPQRGSTAWTSEKLYLRNSTAGGATATICFMR